MGGGGEKDPSNITAAIQDRDIISTAIPQFSGTPNPMKILVKLPDATGSGKSKMAAKKLEIHISPLVQKIATKLQRLYLGVWVQLSNGSGGNAVRPNGEKPEVEKSKMAAYKLEIRLCQLVYKIAMQFQRLYLCFRGPAILWKRWHCCTTKRGETGSGKSKMAVPKRDIIIS